MPGPPPSTTRRAALGGLVTGALLLIGCDAEDLMPPDAEPTPEPTPPSGDPDPDLALVDGVVEQVSAAWLAVTSVRSYPVLRVPLGPLQRLHEAHLEVLDAPPEGSAVRPTGPAAQQYVEVRRLEARLARRLADAAVDADSGALARLLASMSAAVTQRLAAMPEMIGPDDGGRR